MNLETKRIKLKTITPIHIGSGEKISKEFIKIDGDNLYILGIDANKINIDELFHLIFNIDALLSRAGYNVEKIKLYKSLSEGKKDLERFIRTVDLESKEVVYLPGSGIKGYIMNSIYYERKDIVEIHNEKKNIFKKIKIKDITNDYKVFLSDFLPVDKELFASEIKIMNLLKNGLFKRKFSIFAEIVNGTFSGTISIDKSNNKISSVADLLKTLNKFTKWCVSNEIEILDKYRSSEINEYINELERIISMLERDKIIIRVGKYTGSLYKSLIKLIETKYPNEARELINKMRHKPYKYPDVPFPKTIKMLPDGKPLGFVEISFDDEK